ncbi:hypothetical protein SLS53_009163 [Cytospora paraplurivora]|uniref:Uncharacterized protein n=1 Tax=Cytospora paraplurivora TaxID=2898453 RepID=A0AAN9YC17_9PEZI
METIWSSYYDDVNKYPLDAFMRRMALERPYPGSYPLARVLAQWLDYEKRSGELDVQERELFESLSYVSGREICDTIDTIIFFMRNIIANGLELPSLVQVEDQRLKEDILHFWHLLHHDFGQHKINDSVIRGRIYEILSASCIDDPLHAFESCEHLLKSSRILQALLSKNPYLSSKLVLEYTRSGNAREMQKVFLDEHETEDNVFGRKVQHMTTSLARADIPQIEGNTKVAVGGRVTVQTCPDLIFITLQRPDQTEDEGDATWWSFKQLKSFHERFTTFEPDQDGRLEGLHRWMLYTLCLVLHMSNDQVRVYDPLVDPMPQIVTENRNVDTGEWKVDVDAGPFLLVYRQADVDVDEEELQDRQDQFTPPILTQGSAPPGSFIHLLERDDDLEVLSRRANETPPNQRFEGLPEVNWDKEDGEITDE